MCSSINRDIITGMQEYQFKMVDHLILDANESTNVQIRDLLREKSLFKNQPEIGRAHV